MGAPRQHAEPGTGSADGFHVHVETGRARGSLSVVLAVPREPPGALAAALQRLHHPGGPLDLDVRLGDLAASAPPGTAFLVGLDDQVWVFPSPSLPARRSGGDGAEILDEPQVVPLRAGERVELLRGGTDERLGAIVADADAAPARPTRTVPVASRSRRRLAVPVVVLAVLGAALLVGVLRSDRDGSGEGVGASFGAPDLRATPSPARETPPAPAAEVAATTEAPEETPPPVAEAPAETPAPPADPWEFRASGAITSSPLLVGDRVVFGSRDSTLYCLDAHTGERLWSVPAGSGVGSSPRAAEGVCFVGTYGGDVLAVDLATGKVRWQASTGGKIVASPCVAGDLVVVGSYDRAVHAFDRKSGARRWEFPTQGVVRASAEPLGADRVAVGSGDGTLYCLRASDGRLVWSRATRGAIFAAGAFDPERDLFVVGTQNGTALGVSASSGEVRWSVPVGAEVNGQPRFAGDVVLVGTGRGKLLALDPASGEARWNARAQRGFDARPLVLGSTVVAPSFDGVVHLLDLADGAEKGHEALGSGIWSSPEAGNGRLYVGTLGGSLHALRLP